MSELNGQRLSCPPDLVVYLQAEFQKIAASFEFAAHEGRTESHNSSRYLQLSYDRYSRTVEDFLLETRLFRRCLPLSPAQSAEWLVFEDLAAQTLQQVQNELCISENHLTQEGIAADSKKCEERQRTAADMFVDLARELRAIAANM